MATRTVIERSSQRPSRQGFQSGDNTQQENPETTQSFADCLTSNCVTTAITVLAIGIIVSFLSACGIVSEVVGNVILTSSGLSRYADGSKAVEMGWRGGFLGFFIAGVFCGAMFSLQAARNHPIITLPFLVVGGVLTGVFGFANISRIYSSKELGGLTYTHAVRAGALGSAVVGGISLLVLSLFLRHWSTRAEVNPKAAEIPLIYDRETV